VKGSSAIRSPPTTPLPSPNGCSTALRLAEPRCAEHFHIPFQSGETPCSEAMAARLTASACLHSGSSSASATDASIGRSRCRTAICGLSRANSEASFSRHHGPGGGDSARLLKHRRPNSPRPNTACRHAGQDKVSGRPSRWSGSSSSLPWWRVKPAGASGPLPGPGAARSAGGGSNPAIPPSCGPDRTNRLTFLPRQLKQAGKDLPSR